MDLSALVLTSTVVLALAVVLHKMVL